jgi:hypothetical protein
MRRAHPLLSVLLLATIVACGTGTGEAGAPAPPLSLPTPPGPEGTAPARTVGGVASKLTPSPTPEYLRQLGVKTQEMGTGVLRMVNTADGGRNNPTGVTELSVLEAGWDNGAGRSRLHLDPTGAIKAGIKSWVKGFGGPVDMVHIGDVQYLRMGGAPRWTKLEANPRASAVRPIFDLFRISEVGGLLGALGCAGPVEELPGEEIDRAKTHHYRVSAPSAKIKACTENNSEAGGLLANLGDSEQATVDVWADEGHLVRRLVITADEKALGEDLAERFRGATSVVTMSLSGFGEPAGIEAPPASEVDEGLGLDLAGLSGNGGSGSGDMDLDELLSQFE